MAERKNIRLKDYDYSKSGYYFITICTKDKKQIFWNGVGADIIRPGNYVLSKYGQIVDNVILDISNHYENIIVDKYIIMPNKGNKWYKWADNIRPYNIYSCRPNEKKNF